MDLFEVETKTFSDRFCFYHVSLKGLKKGWNIRKVWINEWNMRLITESDGKSSQKFYNGWTFSHLCLGLVSEYGIP